MMLALVTGVVLGAVSVWFFARRSRRKADRLLDEAAARRVVSAWAEWSGSRSRPS
jgi:uncharacterized membrane protein YbaN (DUF454 family)